jgi:hypothetical protein
VWCGVNANWPDALGGIKLTSPLACDIKAVPR